MIKKKKKTCICSPDLSPELQTYLSNCQRSPLAYHSGLHLHTTQGIILRLHSYQLHLMVLLPPLLLLPTQGLLPRNFIFREMAIIHFIAQVKKPGTQ